MKSSIASTTKKTLSIDIGGYHIKATVLDARGRELTAFQSIVTPKPATPEKVLDAVKTLAVDFPPYDRISAGFPGYVKDGVVHTAPNLDNQSWSQFNLSEKLSEALGKPARVVNDADLLGLGVAKGKGLEMMITLGTGFGTAFINDGMLLPHIELAHHPVTTKETYDDYVGERGFEAVGLIKWNKRMQRVINILKTVFNYDFLYIGGGNSANLNFKLDKNVKIVTNEDGIEGGLALWEQDKNSRKPLGKISR